MLRRDGVEIIGRIKDEAGTVIYCDPPYLTKGAEYTHDFSSRDHLRLAAELNCFKLARVVVSYYDDPALMTLYPAWDKIAVSVRKDMSLQGHRGGSGTMAPEVLLVNKTWGR